MSLLRILAKRSATLANPAARRTFVSFSAPRFEEGGEEAAAEEGGEEAPVEEGGEA